MLPVHLLRWRSSIFPLSLLSLLAANVWLGFAPSLQANAIAKPRAITTSGMRPKVAQAPVPKESPPVPAPSEVPPPAGEGILDKPSSGTLPGPTASEDEVVTIPQSSAIIVSFPAEIILDPKRKHNLPITLPLLQPIVDTDGQVVAPAKSLVLAQLKAIKGGDLIEVTAVVVGGRVIPLHSEAVLVPAQHKFEDVAAYFSNANPSRLNNVLNSAQTWQLTQSFGSDSDNPSISKFDLIGLGLAIGFGATQPVNKLPPPFVNIAQGSVYILTLAAPITIPKRLVETGIQIRESLGEEGTIVPR
jgi:hypothetical protein